MLIKIVTRSSFQGTAINLANIICEASEKFESNISML